MVVFVLPKKRSYRKLYRRWFDSSIDVLTDRYNLKVRAPISSAQSCGRGKIRYAGRLAAMNGGTCKDTNPLALKYNIKKTMHLRESQLFELTLFPYELLPVFT